jgi:predicted HAD superfamily hydrolase
LGKKLQEKTNFLFGTLWQTKNSALEVKTLKEQYKDFLLRKKGGVEDILAIKPLP